MLNILKVMIVLLILNTVFMAAMWQRPDKTVPVPTEYFELTIGSFTSVHAYGGFSSHAGAQERVDWLKANGYMAATQPYFIQPRRLNDTLVLIDAGGR